MIHDVTYDVPANVPVTDVAVRRFGARRPVANRYVALLGIALLMAVLAAFGVPARPSFAAPEDPAAPIPTRFYTTTLTLPTYPYTGALETVTDPDYNLAYPVLDWQRYRASNPVPRPQTYTLLVMENDHLKVTLLPALGGRVYQIIDKSTGHNHLYQNPVLRPTYGGEPDQGWWMAVGGIEWALPAGMHGYEWGMPWSWSVIESGDGITVTVRDSTAEDRLRAVVDVFLPSDRAYLVLAPRLENPTGAPVEADVWLNAYLAPGAPNVPTAGLTFLFQVDRMAVTTTGDRRLPGAWPLVPTGPDYLFDWPTHTGITYARLRAWDRWLGFFAYPQAEGPFTGVYDRQQQEGMVRLFSPEDARGAGAFGYGWSRALDWRVWSDEPSGGVVLRSGPAPNPWEQVAVEAGSSVGWRETWYPLHQTGEIAVANREVALGRERLRSATGDRLRVAVQPTRRWAAGETELYVWHRTTCEVLAHTKLDAVGPGSPYVEMVGVGDRGPEEIVVAYLGPDVQVLAADGPVDCLGFQQPAPHLGYGINVRKIDRAPDLVQPLGFEWIKLWEEYSDDVKTDLPYNVLYNISCGAYVDDPEGWGDRVTAVVRASAGQVDAYEICNEPNVKNASWGGNEPDPERFTEMLCVAAERIRQVDPQALVVSGGLAPVGRIAQPWPCGPNNNCTAMDERAYLRAMLDAGAGACIDAFGYHPYGFDHIPERDAGEVANGFAFRGVEALRGILVETGWEAMPVWATEFNWIRKPAGDGYEDCSSSEKFVDYFAWQEVDAETQADYLTRAFEYADAHWPWMEAMFVWNLDWHDYLTWNPCFHSRYYALRRWDESRLGATTPAYAALAVLEKRPGLRPLPMLHVDAGRRSFSARLTQPRVVTVALAITNGGVGELAWTVTTEGDVPLRLSTKAGRQDAVLVATVDTRDLGPGLHRAAVLVTATSPALDGAQRWRETVTIRIVNDLPERLYVPLVIKR